MEIYVLTNTINKKQYVGMTQETPQKRFRRHVVTAKKGSDCAIHRAIRKYGEEAFVIESVDTAATKDELKTKEIKWIVKLNTFGNGYNMTPGGDGGGRKVSDVTKKKMSVTKKKYFQDHPEARKMASEYGRQAVITEDTRRIWHEQRLGNQRAKGMTYHHTVEAKIAISKVHKGKIVSKETRQKISLRENRAYGERNAMADPVNRAKVTASKIGRKREYQSDGSFRYVFPKRLNTHSESPS
jgi:group I intron endonuclease